jgi:hypothetical protein
MALTPKQAEKVLAQALPDHLTATERRLVAQAVAERLDPPKAAS